MGHTLRNEKSSVITELQKQDHRMEAVWRSQERRAQATMEGSSERGFEKNGKWRKKICDKGEWKKVVEREKTQKSI